MCATRCNGTGHPHRSQRTTLAPCRTSPPRVHGVQALPKGAVQVPGKVGRHVQAQQLRQQARGLEQGPGQAAQRAQRPGAGLCVHRAQRVVAKGHHRRSGGGCRAASGRRPGAQPRRLGADAQRAQEAGPCDAHEVGGAAQAHAGRQVQAQQDDGGAGPG